MTTTLKSAAEYTAEADACEASARESFERCDTDGFLSQWSSGINAQLARRNAEIAANGGMRTFERVVLQRLDGSPVDYRTVETRYGTKYRIDATDEWLPYQPKREATLGKRGYREVKEQVEAPAIARFWAPSGARGLSGCSQVQAIVFRDDMPEGQQRREGWYPARSAS